ncbi:MAG TPA: hypothetical protein VIG79_05765 [Lapillicoccus sp.]|uniref:hypothetical protein n=1 Tax=Lapillicoccus sp. TaxID=1909287 RepID=UPI002F940463
MPRSSDARPDFRVLGAPNPPREASELRATSVEQRGLLTREQCLGAGMTAAAVRWKVDRRVWEPVHRGVYQTRPGKDDWHTAALAALLAVPGSAWSHQTAGFVEGLVGTPPLVVDLLVDERRRVATPAGARLHRRVDADAFVDPLHWPWRVDVDHTVLDLAAKGSESDAVALLGRAFSRHLTSEAALRPRLAARTRYPHRGLLDDVLADVADGAQSVMEVRFVRDVERAHGLPLGRRQAPTLSSGLRLHDVAYDEERVLVELDGRLGHEGPARVGDGIRDRRSATLGWLTVRAFWVDVAVTPCELAREVGVILGSCGRSGRLRRCRRRDCVT